MRLFITVALIILYSAIIRGSDVILNIYAEGAAGEYLHIGYLPDPVTGEYEIEEKLLVPGNEEVQLTVECEDICWLKIRSGKNDYLMVVSSGRTYDVHLPPYEPLPRSGLLNPFFEFGLSHIRLDDSKSINNAVRYIDSVFYDYTDIITGSIYIGEKIRNRDSLLKEFEGLGEKIQGDYPSKYYLYRECLLNMIAYRGTDPGEEELNIINREFLPGMPAYADLITQVFNGYIRQIIIDDRADSLGIYINSGEQFDRLIEMLKKQGELKDTSLIEFVLLSNLYSEYYRSGFRKEAVGKFFQWLSVNAVNDYNRSLALRITEKINRLNPGTEPPGFMLKGSEGKIYTLDSLRGKHTILAFGSMQLPEMKSELKILKSRTARYAERLNVVVVLFDEEFEPSAAWPGFDDTGFIVLDGYGSSNLFRDYDLRYLPSFYLLDPELKLLQSPAILPSENLMRSVVPELGPGLVDDIRY